MEIFDNMQKHLTITLTQEDLDDRFYHNSARYKMFDPVSKEYWRFPEETPKWYIELVLKDFLVGYFWLQTKFDSFEDFTAKVIASYDFKLHPDKGKYETPQAKKITERPNWSKERLIRYIAYLRKGF